MTVEENIQSAEEYLKAYNERDLDRMVTFWADKDAGLARREFQENFWLTAFPDTHMETISVTAQDDRVVGEAIVRATHTGTLKMWVKEPVPATNRRIEFHVCEIILWENGKLKGIRSYVDVADIISQLGVSDSFDWDQ